MMRATEGKATKWLWLSLLLTSIVVLIVQVPLLSDPEYVDEDLRFFFWLHRFADQSLFAADPLLGYQFAEVNLGFASLLFNNVSLVYGMLYAVLAPFFSPFVFSKLLIFPLALTSSYYLFRIGEWIADSFTAFNLTVLFVLIVAVPHSPISLSNGLPRAFTLPLLLAALYYMIIDNYLGMATTLLLSLFYPPVFLTVLLTYGIKVILETLQRRRLALTGNQFATLSVAFLISIALLFPALTTGLNTVPSGPEGSQETTVFTSPLYGDEGRYPLLGPHPLTANGGVLDSGVIGLLSLVLVLLLIPIALVLRRRLIPLPAPFWYLAIGSLVGFGLSWLAILFTPSATFHMPSRYMRGTIFIMSLIMVTINGPQAIQKGSKYLANNRGSLGALSVITAVVGLVIVQLSDVSRTLAGILGVLVTITVILFLIKRKRSRVSSRSDNAPATPGSPDVEHGRASIRIRSILATSVLVFPLLLFLQAPDTFYRPRAQLEELVEFVKTLPQDALVSGYPCYLDDIPLYAQRMILFSCETESRDMDLMKAALDAYFAEANEEVLAFCRQYNVDYMVGGPETFTEEFRNQEHIIFEPLNSFLKQRLEGRSTFALNQIPDGKKVFHNRSYFVVPCTSDAFASVE